MATQVLTDVRAYVGGLDATTFGSQGWFARAGGLKDVKIDMGGFAVSGAIPGLTQVDDELYADLIGGVSVPAIFVPTSGAVGSLAYLGKWLDVDYKRFGKVGDLDPFQLTANSDGVIARGAVMHPQGTARTATGNGTAQQLGALSATQKLYCVLNVLSITGTTPSITVALQSNVDNTFGAPTTRGTFTAVTTQVGAPAMVVVAGPVTDTWWRVTWTIAGTTPSYLFAAAAGIV